MATQTKPRDQIEGVRRGNGDYETTKLLLIGIARSDTHAVVGIFREWEARSRPALSRSNRIGGSVGKVRLLLLMVVLL